MSKIIEFPAESIFTPSPLDLEPVALSIDEFIRLVAARQAAPVPADPAAAAPVQPASAPKVNKYGVKIGDLFYASWGYEQTNVDFFQVIALVGKTSVRVRQVTPPLIEEDATGPMAANRSYKVGNLPILEPHDSSIFIKDQQKGDLKRLKSYAADGVSSPQFTISPYADAHHCGGDTVKCYESWYY